MCPVRFAPYENQTSRPDEAQYTNQTHHPDGLSKNPEKNTFKIGCTFPAGPKPHAPWPGALPRAQQRCFGVLSAIRVVLGILTILGTGPTRTRPPRAATPTPSPKRHHRERGLFSVVRIIDTDASVARRSAACRGSGSGTRGYGAGGADRRRRAGHCAQTRSRCCPCSRP